MMTTQIRILKPNDARKYWDLRLRMLREEPNAFGASYEEALETSFEEIAQRFQDRWTTEENFIVGAFADDQLVGVVGFYRQDGLKSRHKGTIWGMYVAPEARGQGIGRTLLSEAIAHAKMLSGLEQIGLSVVTEKRAARNLYRSLGFNVYGLESRALKLGEQYLDEEHMVLWLDEA